MNPAPDTTAASVPASDGNATIAQTGAPGVPTLGIEEEHEAGADGGAEQQTGSLYELLDHDPAFP